MFLLSLLTNKDS